VASFYSPVSPASSLDLLEECLISKLFIDRDQCIDCGKCKIVCIRNHLKIVDKKAVEVGENCFECGHCLAVCPTDSIKLARFVDAKNREFSKDSGIISPNDMLDLLARRRSIRWFKDKKITKDIFLKLFEAAYYSPTAMNAQGTEFVVIDEQLAEFMDVVWDIIQVLANKYPRIAEFGAYRQGEGKFKAHPILWEGKQIICTFSEFPADALIASTRLELMAYTMGLGGFYSHFILEASRLDSPRLMQFFPEITSGKIMQSVFIVGYPRIEFIRSIPRKPLSIYWK
jgi:nitroreductase/Pyruvate/2-oxoacid:ferredoxin oxidoreductase delta subunit